MATNHHPFTIIVWVLFALPPAAVWIVPQPRQNIWVTSAKILQDSLCMSIESVNDPLSTCLVGIPLTANNYLHVGKRPTPVDTWDEWTKILLHASEEPQELTVSSFTMGN